MRGFSLLEVIVYIGVLVLIVAGAVRLTISSSFNLGEIRAEREIFADGEFAMQTIIRDIRLASAVVTAGSAFGANPGALQLTTLQKPGSSTEATKTFSVSGARLTRQIDSYATEFLTSPRVRIIDLTFWRSSNTYSNLIRIKLTLEAGRGRSLERATLYGAAVLRGGY